MFHKTELIENLQLIVSLNIIQKLDFLKFLFGNYFRCFQNSTKNIRILFPLFLTGPIDQLLAFHPICFIICAPMVKCSCSPSVSVFLFLSHIRTHTREIFFMDHLRVSCIHLVPFPEILKSVFPGAGLFPYATTVHFCQLTQ